MSAIAIAPALAPRPLAQSRMRGALRPTKLSTMNRLNGTVLPPTYGSPPLCSLINTRF